MMYVHCMQLSVHSCAADHSKSVIKMSTVVLDSDY